MRTMSTRYDVLRRLGALAVVFAGLTAGCQEPDADHQGACGDGSQAVITAGGAGCVSEVVAARPRVTEFQLRSLTLGDGASLMVGHDVAVSVDLALDAEPLQTSVIVRLASGQRGTYCVLGTLPVRHGRKTPGADALTRRYALSSELTVPDACVPLLGVTDLVAWASFDPNEAVWVDARDVASPGDASAPGSSTRRQRLDTAPLHCSGLPGGACEPLRLVASAGVDLRLGRLALPSNVAVLEVAGPALLAGEQTAGRGTPGEPDAALGTAATNPADFAPDLDPSPVFSASAALSAGGRRPGDGFEAPDLALTLSVRPAGASDDAWVTLATQGGEAPVEVPQRGARVGVALSASPDAALRERLLTGDWAAETLFELRACAATSTPEAGPSTAPKANNCASRDVALLRLERPYGPHTYPEGAGNDSASSDYFEIGKTETSGNPVLQLNRFRGGYREVAGGHVRLGGVFWTSLSSTLFSFDSGKLAVARAFHDTAPLAQDFVSGTIELMGFPTIDLPDYDVPDSFKFALDAAVNTSQSSMTFGGTANLAPLVSALNWVGKQAQAGGPEFCVFDDFCLPKVPLMGSISLTAGFALAKGIDKPDCTVVPGLGCYLKEDAPASHFWANAAVCAKKGASMPSNHGTVNNASKLRTYANLLAEPFYLGMFREGYDYRYLMSQVFFETNWVQYGTPHASVMPTYWAFLDVSMIPEKAACAVQAPDLFTKLMRVNYDAGTVAQVAPSNPSIRSTASRAHVPCQATLPAVCEYPVSAEGEVEYERNELYLQFAGQLIVDASISTSQSLLNFSGSVNVEGNLLTTTWAATVGQRWFATKRQNGAWLTQGNAFGNVAINGSLGKITISGRACVLFGLGEVCVPGLFCTPSVGHEECLDISLGGFTSLLPKVEVGAYYSAQFLPFDVESAP
jgi:hypothetical protein